MVSTLAVRLAPNPADIAVAAQFAVALHSRLGLRLQRAILFGSHARGDAHGESDFGLFVVVDRRDAPVKRRVDDAAFEFFPRFLDIHVFTPERWAWSRSADAPLVRHALEEGVAVWPTEPSGGGSSPLSTRSCPLIAPRPGKGRWGTLRSRPPGPARRGDGAPGHRDALPHSDIMEESVALDEDADTRSELRGRPSAT